MKYLDRVRPWGLSLLEPKAISTELSVKRITQLRFENVILCFTIMTERMRLNASWDERRSEEVETGR